MLDPEQGYTRARKILRDLFGQPFKVARNLIEGVMVEAKRTKGDVYSMTDLVIEVAKLPNSPRTFRLQG